MFKGPGPLTHLPPFVSRFRCKLRWPQTRFGAFHGHGGFRGFTVSNPRCFGFSQEVAWRSANAFYMYTGDICAPDGNLCTKTQEIDLAPINPAAGRCPGSIHRWMALAYEVGRRERLTGAACSVFQM
jgi:hypothetical protein